MQTRREAFDNRAEIIVNFILAVFKNNLFLTVGMFKRKFTTQVSESRFIRAQQRLRKKRKVCFKI